MSRDRASAKLTNRAAMTSRLSTVIVGLWELRLKQMNPVVAVVPDVLDRERKPQSLTPNPHSEFLSHLPHRRIERTLAGHDTAARRHPDALVGGAHQQHPALAPEHREGTGVPRSR